MKNKILVVSPHADDETLGCGGTLLKHKKNGDEINWLLMTKLKKNKKYNSKVVKQKNNEIKMVNKAYGFKNFFQLNFQPSSLDLENFEKIIDQINHYFNLIKPNIFICHLKMIFIQTTKLLLEHVLL